MDLNELNKIVQILKNKRKLFHSESDFQHSLAFLISKKKHAIRLEKPIYLYNKSNKKNDYEKIELDILANNETAIELKYKTRCLNPKNEKKFEMFGEEYQISNHAAQNLARYDFFKDINRISKLINEKKVKNGFVIFLTNDHLYFKNELKGDKNMSQDFCMSLDRKIVRKGKQLNWRGYKDKNDLQNSVSKKRITPIELKKDIKLNWQQYSTIPHAKKANTFKYLIVEV